MSPRPPDPSDVPHSKARLDHGALCVDQRAIAREAICLFLRPIIALSKALSEHRVLTDESAVGEAVARLSELEEAEEARLLLEVSLLSEHLPHLPRGDVVEVDEADGVEAVADGEEAVADVAHFFLSFMWCVCGGVSIPLCPISPPCQRVSYHFFFLPAERKVDSVRAPPPEPPQDRKRELIEKGRGRAPDRAPSPSRLDHAHKVGEHDLAELRTCGAEYPVRVLLPVRCHFIVPHHNTDKLDALRLRHLTQAF